MDPLKLQQRQSPLIVLITGLLELSLKADLAGILMLVGGMVHGIRRVCG
jgi:hypothetical protein